MELKFRDLTKEEVELRVGATTEKGFTLLLYKTARVDAGILDETVGPFNWQKRFYQVKNTMICEVAINVFYNDETKEPRFIAKGDAGDESNTEAIKGEASDSFKRAGFAWGIGRKLYNSPFVWINKDDNNDPKKTRYVVSEIAFDETSVSKLVICNEKTNEVVYSYPKGAKVVNSGENTPKTTTSQKGTIRDSERKLILEFMKTLDEEKINQFYQWLEKKFKTSSINSLSAEEGIIVCKSWKLM